MLNNILQLAQILSEQIMKIIININDNKSRLKEKLSLMTYYNTAYCKIYKTN